MNKGKIYIQPLFDREGGNIESTCFLDLSWQDIKVFFDSTFFIAITGSLAGAFAGAYGAYRIAKKSKYREELLTEIRYTNATIMVALSMFNTLLSMKRQHVRPLKKDYDAKRKACLAHIDKQRDKKGEKDTYEFEADLESLSMPHLPVNVLQQHLYEKLSLTGRPLIVIMVLNQSMHGLREAFDGRNQWIKSNKANDLKAFEPLYFGLPLSGGHIDQVYPNLIDAIYTQTDDGLFFSSLLCKDLVNYGDKIVAQFKKEFGKGAPKINIPVLDKPEIEELMPDSDEYAEWENMIVKEKTR